MVCGFTCGGPNCWAGVWSVCLCVYVCAGVRVCVCRRIHGCLTLFLRGKVRNDLCDGFKMTCKTSSISTNVCGQNVAHKMGNVAYITDPLLLWFNQMLRIYFYTSCMYMFIYSRQHLSLFTQTVRKYRFNLQQGWFYVFEACLNRFIVQKGLLLWCGVHGAYLWCLMGENNSFPSKSKCYGFVMTTHVIITPLLRQTDVTVSFWRNSEVILRRVTAGYTPGSQWP